MFPPIVSIIQIAVIIACPMWCMSGSCVAGQCCDSSNVRMVSPDLDVAKRAFCEAEVVDSTSAAEACSSCPCSESETEEHCETTDLSETTDRFEADFDSCSHTTCPGESCPGESCPNESCQCVCGGAINAKPIEIDRVFESALSSLAGFDNFISRQLHAVQLPVARQVLRDHNGNIGRFMRILRRSFVI